jgi:hypothetical protein
MTLISDRLGLLRGQVKSPKIPGFLSDAIPGSMRSEAYSLGFYLHTQETAGTSQDLAMPKGNLCQKWSFYIDPRVHCETNFPGINAARYTDIYLWAYLEHPDSTSRGSSQYHPPKLPLRLPHGH